MEANGQKHAHSGYKFIIVVLMLLLAGLAVWYAREAHQWNNVNKEMTAVRDSLSQKLGDMLWEYETMKTDNANIKQELETEKEKIQMLLQKMHTTERVHYAEISKYEREANTLRDIMRSYIRQIDSLNTLSQKLIAENREVKQDLQTSRKENQKLTEEKENLSSQIEKGSVLKVRNVAAEGLNSRDKNTNSASRTKKIKACFTINENTITKPGVREAYLRVTTPDKSLLANHDNGSFTANAETLVYSAKREVDYQNADLETCIYYDTKDAKLLKGAYTVEVYIDGNLSGKGDFLLK
jgi:predicted  nucleic acid-binding Zn-ribbon protein